MTKSAIVEQAIQNWEETTRHRLPEDILLMELAEICKREWERKKSEKPILKKSRNAFIQWLDELAVDLKSKGLDDYQVHEITSRIRL